MKLFTHYYLVCIRYAGYEVTDTDVHASYQHITTTFFETKEALMEAVVPVLKNYLENPNAESSYKIKGKEHLDLKEYYKEYIKEKSLDSCAL